MPDQRDPQLRKVWWQTLVPVVYRQGHGKPLLVRLPFAETNREWLRNDKRNKPHWDPQYKCWEVPKAWFENLIRRLTHRFGSVYVVQPFNTNEKCAPACWNAVGIECECSCMGRNHGSSNPEGKWHVVSNTLAVQWGTKQYSCRLIGKYSAPNNSINR